MYYRVKAASASIFGLWLFWLKSWSSPHRVINNTPRIIILYIWTFYRNIFVFESYAKGRDILSRGQYIFVWGGRGQRDGFLAGPFRISTGPCVPLALNRNEGPFFFTRFVFFFFNISISRSSIFNIMEYFYVGMGLERCFTWIINGH